MALNKAMIIGNLGDDPELRYTQSGTPVANMSIATNRSWTNDQGQKQERTEWQRVVVFGRQAENCEQYLGKGRQVYVEGRIQTREWEDKSGSQRYTTEIVAQTVQFLSGGAGGGGGGFSEPPPYTDADMGSSGGGGGGGPASGSEGDFDQSFDDDDIPF